MATKINREALRQRIKELAGLTDDERAALLELVNTKKYGLVWENHPEDVEERLRTSLPVLEEVKERHIPGSTPDSPTHILIEGDNLEALTALTYTHEGKIDIIYIDPPYNTGNKDFVYNDKYVDSEDDFRHSKWLSFMDKRLRIAKRLLSNKGVIFISIDDNEQATLKLLCDMIFGTSSYVSTLIIESSVIAGPRRVPAMQGSIVKTAEYCLIYTRKADTKIMVNLKYDYISGFDTHYNKWLDENNNRIISLPELIQNNLNVASEFNKYGLSISTQNFGKILLLEDRIKQWLYSDQIASYLYRQGEKEDIDAADTIQENHLFKVGSKWYIKTNDTVYNVFRYIDRIGECNDYFNNYGERTVRGNLWKGFSSDGGNLEKEGGVSFKNGKKPIRLIKQLLDSVDSSKNTIILDFFAGSGTTIDAVMQLNKEDGGKRKCIIVTNNENNICTEKTYIRCRNVINGYGKSIGLNDNSLRYYKTKLLPRQRTNRNMHDLMNAATDLLCIKENLYDEILIHDLPIKNIRHHVRFYGNDKRRMLIIYNEEAIPRVVPWIATSDFLPKERIKVYTFSYNNYAYDDDFAEVEDRVQLCALPAAIYEAYHRVLPKENRYYDDEPIDGKEDEA